MKIDWFTDYETRKWTLYKVLFYSAERKEFYDSVRICEDSELFVCSEASPLDEARWRRGQTLKKILFYDVEQLLAMDLDTVYGVDEVSILTKEWRGHPPGSLAMSIYKGVDEDPPCLTICIAKA